MAICLENWLLRRADEFSVGPIGLDFDDATVTTLIGPSGIGKTSLLMSVLGYEETGLELTGKRSQNGAVLKTGEILNDALYIPQQFPFNPNWEVSSFLDKLPWGKRTFVSGIPPFRSARRRQILEVLDSLGIAHRARATIAELSGGEAQRAALAQMLLLKPNVLVGDEFVSALDPGMTTWILDQCRRQVADSGGVALLALHDIHAAMHVSDRILLIWPNDVGLHPWIIKRGTFLWRSDVLYSLACLSRWAKDLPGNVALRHLISRLSRWHHDELSLIQEFSSRVEGQILVIDNTNNITPLRRTSNQSVPESFLDDNPAEMTAVRFDHHGMIGVTIPQGKEQSALKLLAVNEGAI